MTTLRTPWDGNTAGTLGQAVFREGWSRVLPPIGAVLLSGAALRMRPSTLDELSAQLRSPSNPEARWDAPCWEEPEHYTAESLAELNEQWPDDDQEDRSPEEVNAELDAGHKEAVESVDRYAAHLGLGPVRTCRDALGLLAAAGALVLEGETVFPVFPLPMVEKVFPVSDVEREVIESLRYGYEE